MSINKFRNSKSFRFLTGLIILDLLIFQNLYGQEFQLQEGTNVYSPVKETNVGAIHESPLQDSSGSNFPEQDFLNDSPLSLVEVAAVSPTVAPDSTLTSSSLTSFSGSPWVRLMNGSSSPTSVVQQSNKQFQINYDVTAAGSKSGAYVSFDNPTTSGVEVANLSSLTDLIVGGSGAVGSEIRFEVEDSLGAKSEVLLSNVSASMQYYKISKSLFTGIDWTKVKRFTYSIDNSLTSTLIGTLTIEAKTLLYNSTVITTLPNTPYLALYPSSSALTNVVETSTSGFKLNYNVASAGSISGASIVLDNPSTSAIEKANLSTQSELVFGLSGPLNAKIKVQVEDALGVKSTLTLSGLKSATQYYTLSQNQFNGLDWTQITKIHFFIDTTLGNPNTGTLTIQAKTLTYSSTLLTNLPASPSLELLSGSTTDTFLSQPNNSSFALDFSLSGADTKSGAVINFDKASTSQIETQNLSTLNQFVFSAKGIANGKLKIEMEDLAGNKASYVLTGLTTAVQYYVLSKSLFSGIDLTKVKRITFSIDPTLTSLTSGTLTVGAKTLLYNATAATTFAGSPSPLVLEGSSAPTYLTATSTTQMKMNFDVTQAGSFAGTQFSFDDLNTSSVETRDLSQGTTLTLGLQGGNANIKKVKLEIEDATGAKVSYLVQGLTTGNQYYTLQKSLFPGIDWTKVKSLNFVLDQSMISASSAYVNWLQFTLNGFLYSRTVIPCTSCTSASVTILPGSSSLFLLPGSSNGTALAENTGNFNLSFDLNPSQSYSGARITYDKPSTSAIETVSLPSTLIFGLKAPANTVRLEITDIANKKSSVILTGISTTEKFFSTSTSWFTGIDKTKIKWIQFIIDPVTGNNAPNTGSLEVSVKGLTVPVFSVPTLEPISSPVNNLTVTLKGTKGLGSGIAVNGQMILAPTDSTTWEAQVNLPVEGENILNVQETNGAGTFGPTTPLTVIRSTKPHATQLLSESYVYHRNYQLRYKDDGVEKSEWIELSPGKNQITRTFGLTSVTWNIYLDENAERGAFFDYDANGNVISRRDANGLETEYEYDANNQLIKITYADGAIVRYTYNARGDRTSMSDSTGNTYYYYDVANRLQAIQHNSDYIDYNYDLAGNLIEMIYKGITVKYSYDEVNRLKEVREQKTGEADKVTSYIYNDAGDLTSEILPNNIRTRYVYDLAARLTDVIHEKMEIGEAITFLDSYQYTLDAAGNRTRMVETRGTGSNQTIRTLDYTYDLFGRLIREIDSSRGTTDYTYDIAGNRLSKNFIPTVITSENPRILTAYTYGIDNRLLGLVEGKFDNAGNLLETHTEYFVYDAAGNMIQKITPEKTYHYEYNSENRLVAWTDEKDFVEFTYDADGNRTGKRVNGEWTYYVVDPNRAVSQVLAELDSTRGVKQTYAYGLDRVSVTSHQTPVTRYFLQDGLGSSVGLTDSTGLLTDSFSYDAFGNLPPSTLPLTASFLYAGEQFDPETGLVYLRARYYDPTLGRFISRDPVLGDDNQTQSFNPYPYVQNNPINYADPSGENPALLGAATAIYLCASNPACVEKIYLIYNAVTQGIGGYQTAYEFAHDELGRNALASFGYGILGAGAGALFSTNSPEGPTYDSQIQEMVSLLDKGIQNAIDYVETLTSQNTYETELARSIFGDDFYDKYYWGGDPPGGGDLFSDNFSDFGNDWGQSLLGSYVPDSVGGVLLDKSLEITGLSINDVTGVTYDPFTGQVVLLGEAGGTVPEIPMDYLITALKAVFGSEQDPGVTMEAKKNPDGSPDWSQPLDVIHFAGIEDTELGWVVYEADRLMKSINHGKDNITNSTITADGYDISESFIASQIPDFKNMLTRWTDNPSTETRYVRFWFRPKEMKLVRSNDQNAFVFDNNSVELLTEDLIVGSGAQDPDAKAHADFFTEHYDEFANLYPIFEELKKAARAVALAKFIADQNIPVDLTWLENASLLSHTTPRTTPVGQNSNGTNTIVGGVTVKFIDGQNFVYLPDTQGNTTGLQLESLETRSSDLATQWNFSSAGNTFDASALSFAPTRKDANFYWQESDLYFSTVGDFDLSWDRFYDSFSAVPTQLGYGWRFTPYAIQTTQKSIVREVNGANRRFYPSLRFVNHVNHQTENMIAYSFADGSIRYFPEGILTGTHLLLNTDDSYTLQYDDRQKIHFLSDGKLDYMQDQNGNRIQYSYDGSGKLISITDVVSQRSLSLVYDSFGRVSTVNGPESKSISYAYDASTGDLKTATENWRNRTTTYFYDQEHLLLSATDYSGKVLFVNTYDEMGRLTSQIDSEGNYREINPDLLVQETITTDTANGAQLRQTYDQLMRLTGIEDSLGNLTQYIYSGSYGPTSVIDSRGNTQMRTYSSLGLPKMRTDALGHISRNEYSSTYGDSRLIFQESGTGYGPYMQYDAAGNLISLWETAYAERDAEGNPIQYWVYPFRTQFGYDSSGNLSSITDANLHTSNFLYDPLGNLTKTTDALGKSTEMNYETQETYFDTTIAAIANGDAQIDTAQSKFGGASITLDGNGDYLALADSDDFDFSGGVWTIEGWVNVNSTQGDKAIFGLDNAGVDFFELRVNAGSDPASLMIFIYDENQGGTRLIAQTPALIPLNEWHHVAFEQDGDIYRIYVDGTLKATKTSSVRLKNYTQGAAVGRRGAVYDDDYFLGHIDDLRVTKGMARYKGNNFMIPDSEAVKDESTTLLLRFNGVDGSREIYKTDIVRMPTDRLSSIKDPLNRFVNYTYDPLNQKIRTIRNAAGITRYNYDSRDRISEINDAINRSTQFQYNSNDRLTETRELGNISDLLDDVVATFDYDRLGNLTSIAGPLGGATAFAYDLLNRITRMIAPQDSPLTKIENVGVSDLTVDSAIIHTNLSETVDQVIIRIYEKERSIYRTVTLEGPLGGDMAVEIDGLVAGMDYQFTIEAIDPEGHHSITKKNDFKTLGNSPVPQATLSHAKNFFGQVHDVTSTSVGLNIEYPNIDSDVVKEYKVTVTPRSGGNSSEQIFPANYQDTNGIWRPTKWVDILGLTADTEYDFTIEMVHYSFLPIDKPTPKIGSFRTANPADTIQPSILKNIVITDYDKAVLEFEVSEPLLWIKVEAYDDVTNTQKDYWYYAPGVSGKLLIPDLEPNTSYYYYLAARDLSNNTIWSNSIDFHTNSFDSASPNTLSNRVLSRTATSAVIEIVTDEVSEKIVINYREINTSPWQTVSTTPSTLTTNFSISDLIAGKEYEYQVEVRDLNDNRFISNWKPLVVSESLQAFTASFENVSANSVFESPIVLSSPKSHFSVDMEKLPLDLEKIVSFPLLISPHSLGGAFNLNQDQEMYPSLIQRSIEFMTEEDVIRESNPIHYKELNNQMQNESLTQEFLRKQPNDLPPLLPFVAPGDLMQRDLDSQVNLSDDSVYGDKMTDPEPAPSLLPETVNRLLKERTPLIKDALYSPYSKSNSESEKKKKKGIKPRRLIS